MIIANDQHKVRHPRKYIAHRARLWWVQATASVETANVGKNFHHASPFPEEGEGSLVVAWCWRCRREGRTHRLVSYTHFDCKAEQWALCFQSKHKCSGYPVVLSQRTRCCGRRKKKEKKLRRRSIYRAVRGCHGNRRVFSETRPVWTCMEYTRIIIICLGWFRSNYTQFT